MKIQTLLYSAFGLSFLFASSLPVQAQDFLPTYQFNTAKTDEIMEHISIDLSSYFPLALSSQETTRISPQDLAQYAGKWPVKLAKRALSWCHVMGYPDLDQFSISQRITEPKFNAHIITSDENQTLAVQTKDFQLKSTFSLLPQNSTERYAAVMTGVLGTVTFTTEAVMLGVSRLASNGLGQGAPAMIAAGAFLGTVTCMHGAAYVGRKICSAIQADYAYPWIFENVVCRRPIEMAFPPQATEDLTFLSSSSMNSTAPMIQEP